MYAQQTLQEIASHRKKWESSIREKKDFRTLSGIPVKEVYTPEDVRYDYDSIGFPGEYPYTRGIHPTMYRGRLWTMRMFSGFGSAEDTNKRYKFLLSQGETGLSIAFHFPTLMGYDSDDPRAYGEVGKCGVAIDSLEDMEILLDGIPLDRISTSMTINPPASILLAMYIAVAEKHGIPKSRLTGTIQNDMFKEFIAQKTLMLPLLPSIKIIVDTIEYCTRHVPKWNTVSISGYHIREAGATAVQELAFTLADGLAYVEAALERGLKIDDFAPRLSFFFNSQIDFFEEIAKFRAARRIWSRSMKELGARNPRSLMLRFHTQTAGCSLTAQQPENNIIRTTIEALAAVLGGTQSLHTNSYDEAYALPTEKAVRVALRTQQIIAYESGVTSTVDPLAGSYFVEWLTSEMEERTIEYMEKIKSFGEPPYRMLTGVIKGIENGFFQKEIARSSYSYQREVEEKKRFIVGVNCFQAGHPPIETLKIDEEMQKKQIERLKILKRRRDNEKVMKMLKNLENVARNGGNLMYPVLDCVKSYATVGEICSIFRNVYGEYREAGLF